jgi:putative ABC transport system substrate-binding protein
LLEDDPEEQARFAAFRESLAKLGWIEGSNIRFEYRLTGSVAGREEVLADELVALQPDLILAHGYTTRAVQQRTRTIPIVFVFVAEPVALGYVRTLAHPGGNLTGFTFLEPSVATKWVELLKQIAPPVSRVAVMVNLDTTSIPLEFSRSAEAVAQRFGVQMTMTPVHTTDEIEAVVTRFAGGAEGGLILPADAFTSVHRKLIIDLAMRYKLPLVTGNPTFPEDGGLMYYGADALDLYRRAAPYVDRILRGENPADLPVQAPTKFELIINARTAKALGLDIPPSLMAIADKVIE